MQLDFNVVGQVIERIDATRVAANSQNWIIASFAFDAEWVGTKTAVFTNGLLEDVKVLGVDGVGADKCYVPASVMTQAGIMDVSVYCGSFKTTIVAKVRIEESGEVDVVPAPPADPTQAYVKTLVGTGGIEFIRYNAFDQLEAWNGSEYIVVAGSLEPPAGGYANNLYFGTVTSDVGGYKVLTYTPDVAETVYTNTVQSTDTPYKVFQNYLYSMPVSVSLFPAGLWSFNFYGNVSSSAQVTQIGVVYFKRTTLGVETDLFTAWSNEINNLTDAYIQFQLTNPSFVVDPTDRMGARIVAKTTRTASTTITYKIGDGYGAYLSNPNKIRHSQLRDWNGDPDYQHIDATEKAILGSVSGGITDTKTFVDNNSNSHSVTIANGIITEWTVTPPT